MYYNGQIVHDLEQGKPVKVGDPASGSQWAIDGLPTRCTHYIQDNPEYEMLPKVPKHADGLPQYLMVNNHSYRYTDYKREERHALATPSSIEEAQDLLMKGLITPAPIPHTHHWRCRNWKSNCKCEDKS